MSVQFRPAGSASARRTRRIAAFLLVLSAALCWAPANAAVNISVNGNTALATIELPGGIGADLSLSFSDAQNLDASSLGITAELVDPLALAGRLPGLSPGALSSAFPLMITIEPPAAGGLEFVDTVRVDLHTHNLEYSPGTRLRLFKAPLGGTFSDITDAVEPGSVRTRGRTGGFSQFLVLLDLRPTGTVAIDKYAYLETRLADATGLSLTERASLQSALAQSRAAFERGDPASAIVSLDQFDGQVRQLSGTAIPNRWRAARDLDNVAGDLQGGAATLRFTLGFLRDFGD